MPEFRSFKDMENYLNNTSKGQSSVINQSNVKKALESEMDRLQSYLIEEINYHYSSFTPEYYQRTGAWLESIRVNPIKQDGASFSMSITFDDNFAMHGDAYVPWLMEVGWKNDSYQTPHFEGYEGAHYIQKAVDRWNKSNKYGFNINVYYGTKKYI